MVALCLMFTSTRCGFAFTSRELRTGILTKRIDQTIIPWTYTWLFYFEDWLSTDDWKGGGRHPGEEPEDPGNRALRRALARS